MPGATLTQDILNIYRYRATECSFGEQSIKSNACIMQQPISVEYGLNNDNDIYPNLSSNGSQMGANNLLTT